MTNDIVNRLNVQEECGILYLPESHKFVSYGQAADEIKRLRKEVLEWAEACAIAARGSVDVVNSNERLREALERCANLSECWQDSLVSQINKIAREALKDG